MRLQLLLGIVVALALAACTQVDRGLSEASKKGLADFLDCMRQIAYDYEPADTPAALAAEADAVVTGTIVALRPGQSYAPAPNGGPDTTTSVLEVKVDQVVAGDSAVVADGSVYVEVPTFEHPPCPATFPRAYGVFFVDDRTNESYSDTILDKGAGRPARGSRRHSFRGF